MKALGKNSWVQAEELERLYSAVLMDPTTALERLVLAGQVLTAVTG